MRSFFTSSLVLSLASAAALPAGQQYPDKHPQKYGNKHNHTRLNVQVGDRPYFLVDNMDDGTLKEKLETCSEGPFKTTD